MRTDLAADRMAGQLEAEAVIAGASYCAACGHDNGPAGRRTHPASYGAGPLDDAYGYGFTAGRHPSLYDGLARLEALIGRETGHGAGYCRHALIGAYYVGLRAGETAAAS